ncbi:hypothetical protein ACFVX6_14205 [Streptomyces sp. NPDC058289]|uniref:hypothetical protein n=1 Tax=Streptomyces sp. NPDC058289 TaxID=3346425 RepID=UPI0036E4972F
MNGTLGGATDNAAEAVDNAGAAAPARQLHGVLNAGGRAELEAGDRPGRRL